MTKVMAAFAIIIGIILTAQITLGGGSADFKPKFMGQEVFGSNSKQINYQSGMKQANSNFKSMGIDLGK